MALEKLSANESERFFRKIEYDVNGGCHLWSGSATSDGYGNLTLQGTTRKAHRVAFFIENGPIPDGALVRHKCDTPACVNPDHLEVGTHADNAADKARRGRSTAKVSSDQVKQIRALSGTCREIGAAFGISPASVCMIKSSKRRKYVES